MNVRPPSFAAGTELHRDGEAADYAQPRPAPLGGAMGRREGGVEVWTERERR